MIKDTIKTCMDSTLKEIYETIDHANRQKSQNTVFFLVIQDM